jgi:hypothetical protein
MDGRAPLAGAVRLDLVVELPVPLSWSKKRTLAALRGEVRPTSRPDLHNYVKTALDAINTIVVADDRPPPFVDLKVRPTPQTANFSGGSEAGGSRRDHGNDAIEKPARGGTFFFQTNRST